MNSTCISFCRTIQVNESGSYLIPKGSMCLVSGYSVVLEAAHGDGGLTAAALLALSGVRIERNPFPTVLSPVMGEETILSAGSSLIQHVCFGDKHPGDTEALLQEFCLGGLPPDQNESWTKNGHYGVPGRVLPQPGQGDGTMMNYSFRPFEKQHYPLNGYLQLRGWLITLLSA